MSDKSRSARSADDTPTSPVPDEQEPSRLRAFVKDWLRSILLACLVVFPFRSAVADWHDVPTGSMKPGIVEGDRIVVNRLAYDLKIPFTTVHIAEWGDPERGDIVTLDSPTDGTRLVKRVIGVPGDEIELRANRLVVNGEPLSYASRPNARHDGLPERSGLPQVTLREGGDRDILITPFRRSAHTFGPVKVPPGRYLVLGDNRDDSADSRFFGYVERDAITGRVGAVAFSLDPRGTLRFRADRFAHPLE